MPRYAGLVIAAAIAYLGSPEARFATGTVVRLDGGAGA